MDWASRPEEFRRHHGARLFTLDPPAGDQGPAYSSLYGPHHPPQPLDSAAISSFFYHSLAVSAWKQRSGMCWALRVNPSSGNLHPLEAYLALPVVAGLDGAPAVYHYSPPEHALERLQRLDTGLWEELTTGLPGDAFLVGLTAIHWRCSWKYGERAWRYCRLDSGHALAALRFAAAALGWRLRLLEAPHREITGLFGLRRQEKLPPQERETPELLAAVCPGTGEEDWPPRPLPEAAVARVAEGDWECVLECPERRHRDWPAIDAVERACRTEEPQRLAGSAVLPDPVNVKVAGSEGPVPALQIIRRRRSATALDRRGTMGSDAFYHMLGRLLPSRFASPWDALGAGPLVDLHLMVHRVEGLDPGLYTLARRPDGRDALSRAMNPEYAWQHPEGCPEWLPLSLNLPMDLTDLAEGLSCGQAMASDAIFSLGMTADIEGALNRFGAPIYRRLYQEAGMIGQVLYLEAEASGLRGCGIGCYFDDGVHKLLGSDKDTGPQSLYHFVVGKNVPERGSELLPASRPRRK
jgi:SagB-type dehydrogenase family enzyme